MTTQTQFLSATRTGMLPALAAALLGLSLVFFAGLSQAAILHDTAHDTRHAIAFPCH